MKKVSFLVVYDYGQGGVWAIVHAPSKGEILRRFPELDVVDERPSWMSDEDLSRLSREALDVDRPSGLLSDLIVSRRTPSAPTG